MKIYFVVYFNRTSDRIGIEVAMKNSYIDEQIRQGLKELESWPAWMVRESGLGPALAYFRKYCAENPKK